MIMLETDRFGEIESFNAYAASHSSEIASLLAAVEGIEGLIEIANRLGFDICLEDVRDYTLLQSGCPLTDEVLAVISRPMAGTVLVSTSTGTYQTTVTWTSTVVDVNTYSYGESVTTVIAAAVIVIVAEVV